jgi:serine phosphatase RsbU (regulator of sigma subunit)
MRRRPPESVSQQLMPGDTLVLYTDGVIESRDGDGVLFGRERLTDFVLDDLRRGVSAPEMMRHLIHAVVSYENGELRDDATAAMLRFLT